MRKQLISICTTIILALSIYGCAKTSEEALATETENVGPQDTEAAREEASDEGALDKTVAGEDHEQGEDETDSMSDGAEVTFKFVIEEVYPGTMYEDTCITGIVVDFGNMPDWH